MKKLLPAIFSLLLIIAFIIYLFTNSHKEEVPIERSSVYVASDSLEAMVYREEDSMLYEYVTLVRGTPVISRNIEVEINDGEAVFTQIELEEITEEGEAPTIFYIDSSNLTGSLDNVVMETAKYVRTPVTVYQNSQDAQISGFLKKGTELSICGYEGLQEDGTVEMYRIDNPGNEGYVYAKYLADTQELSRDKSEAGHLRVQRESILRRNRDGILPYPQKWESLGHREQRQKRAIAKPAPEPHSRPGCCPQPGEGWRL